MDKHFKIKSIFAFTGIYVIWGSTYLAIRFTIETLPALLTAGIRSFTAGAVLYVFFRYWKKCPPPSLKDWRAAFIIGGFLLLGANGNVVLAEKFVPSSIAALAMTAIPAMTVLLNWWLLRDRRPTPAMWLGILLGFAGVFLLLAPDLQKTDVHLVPPRVAVGLLFAAFSWSIGSVYARTVSSGLSPFLATGMQMMAGGGMLMGMGLLYGEAVSINPSAFSVKSLAALGYLIVFGSLWGYTAYIWILRNVGAVRASTCAFVNPLVAVGLGSFIGGERLGSQTLLAAVLVIAAVGIITWSQSTKQIVSQRI